LYKHFLISLS